MEAARTAAWASSISTPEINSPLRYYLILPPWKFQSRQIRILFRFKQAYDISNIQGFTQSMQIAVNGCDTVTCTNVNCGCSSAYPPGVIVHLLSLFLPPVPVVLIKLFYYFRILADAATTPLFADALPAISSGPSHSALKNLYSESSTLPMGVASWLHVL